MTTNGRRRSIAVVALIAVLIWPMSGRAEEVSHHLVADVSGEGTIDVQDYHLIGLPWLMPDNGDPLAVFGGGATSYDPTQIGIYQYDPGSGNYLSYTDGLAPVVPGGGYWVITAIDLDLLVQGTPVTTDPYTTTAAPGWNIIGCPFNTTTSTSNIYVRPDASTTPVPLEFNTWVDNQAWGYNNGYFTVIPATAAPGNFEPWNAYWMYNSSTGPVEILIYEPFVPVPSPRPRQPVDGASAEASAAAPDMGISLRVNERLKTYADKTLFLGLSPAASIGPDRLDCMSPPPISSEVPRAYVDHSGWATRPGKYARDFRPLGDRPVNFRVTLKVPNRSGATSYIVRWDLQNLPSGVRATLIDVAADRSVDMRSRSAYTAVVPAHTTARTLRVVVEKK
ncbi:hypothetical protein [Syntrophobacter fumaroxidans]|uniref:Uncharacterized protein n=1 Tax=Syntrophobacter fumaroxidans (strain DSM 10017 / MPOB) TaxID=335543 RepID=A0LQP7_SYNFM|nr:hypothetical protein [Syntrophobacter fumaroxidans]ABK19749.1 hypothetical protein Sfum_4084 [Syntrophobacter fumaroxidans MPOB]